jgi:hypothetical protein
VKEVIYQLGVIGSISIPLYLLVEKLIPTSSLAFALMIGWTASEILFKKFWNEYLTIAERLGLADKISKGEIYERE